MQYVGARRLSATKQMGHFQRPGDSANILWGWKYAKRNIFFGETIGNVLFLPTDENKRVPVPGVATAVGLCCGKCQSGDDILGRPKPISSIHGNARGPAGAMV